MTDGYKIIGIIAALDRELDLLAATMKDCEKITKTGMDFFHGRLGKYEVVLTRCGMGKVSAAAGTQALISLFEPDCVINTGCAGALAGELGLGDFVISDTTVEWDIDFNVLNLPRGYVSAIDMVEIPADACIGNMIEKAIPPDRKAMRGLIVSGDQFVAFDEQKKIIFESFPGALCAEMEGAAVGHVCAQNKIPFCVVRCISDTADGGSGVDFATFSYIAGEKSAEIIIKALES